MYYGFAFYNFKRIPILYTTLAKFIIASRIIEPVTARGGECSFLYITKENKYNGFWQIDLYPRKPYHEICCLKTGHFSKL
ncbi:hypothetical protein ED312_05020 [Sinomicrobium pectinilyticum]|uniref:Uncharacterized protein n=1 Tax=Sinomicrobium pectinilyticum TaxID=1084421 RepID=A0A3N0ET37_SINP1|nr:hypothetical protein ED312_05020 [Sinomicrobium pectinilyticum]